MTVNHEIKSHLARLLATEDLVVEHKKVEAETETASTTTSKGTSPSTQEASR